MVDCGQVELALRENRKAKEMFEKALKIAKVTDGEKSALVEMIQSLIQKSEKRNVVTGRRRG